VVDVVRRVTATVSPRVSHKPRVLCVDDEAAILEAMRDQLRRGFDVQVAGNGPDALAELKADPTEYAVVISDMRMPGMTGATVLREARRIAPLTTRIMLTGYADMDAAIRAVNEGQIYRFLTKPCPSEQLRHVCAAAVGRHRMLTAERRLVEHAQYDTIDALASTLTATTPARLAAGTDLAAAVARLALAAGRVEARETQLAARLIHLTATALPDHTARRLPVLATVFEILRSRSRRFDSIAEEGPLHEGARMLRIVADHRTAIVEHREPRAALACLYRRPGVYDPELLDAFAHSLARGCARLGSDA
jgi:response regulator RpfG family c-di-GMP phosphodiesterase